jgi:hypothetical protein
VGDETTLGLFAYLEAAAAASGVVGVVEVAPGHSDWATRVGLRTVEALT